LQQRAVPILALTHPVDFRLETRDLSIQVLQRDLQCPEPITGSDLLGLNPLDVGTLGQAAGAAVRLRLSCFLSPAGVVDVPGIGANPAHVYR
jgi:hypothetical protein